MTGYILNLFLHIVFAAFWIGGMLFLPLVMLPAIKTNPKRKEILNKSGLKFRKYGWLFLTGMVITGIINMQYKGMSFESKFILYNPLGRILLIKLLVFMVMLLVLGFHDLYIGEKILHHKNEENMKVVARWSGRINLILSLLIALLGIMLSRGVTEL